MIFYCRAKNAFGGGWLRPVFPLDRDAVSLRPSVCITKGKREKIPMKWVWAKGKDNRDAAAAKLGPMKEKGLRIKGENAVFARAKAESREEGNGTYDVFGSFEFARCFECDWLLHLENSWDKMLESRNGYWQAEIICLQLGLTVGKSNKHLKKLWLPSYTLMS